MAKAAFSKKENFFTTKLDLNLRKKLVNGTFGAWLCMVLKLGRSGQQSRNAWKILKCGARKGWRRSVGPIM